MADWVASGIVGAIVTCAVSPFVLPLARRRLLDQPNERSNHSVPTPRGGGVALAAGLLAGLLILAPVDAPLAGTYAAAMALGIMGLAEDLRQTSAKIRLALQTMIALLVLPLLFNNSDQATIWLVVAGAMTVIWIVGYTNSFNFMDGVNGMAVSQLVVAGSAWLAIGFIEDLASLQGLGALTIGVGIGFAPWNVPIARMFLGDAGSYLSGGWLAASAIVGIRLNVEPVAMLAPLAIFVLDTASTLVTKVRAGIPWLSPHKSHVYQRLVGGGWSHRRTAAYFGLLALAMSAAGLLWLADVWLLSVASTVGLLGLAALYLVTPRLLGFGAPDWTEITAASDAVGPQ